MEVHPVGATQVDPRTYFFWHPDSNATVELTTLSEHALLVTATKHYRLLKQSEKGRTETQKLHQLNDYLADKFNQFQITLDYTDTAAVEPTGVTDELREAVETGDELKQRNSELRESIQTLKTQARHGLEQFQDHIESQLAGKQEEVEANEEQLEQVNEFIEERLQARNQWRQNGVSMAFTFSFSADPLICSLGEAEEVIQNQIDEALSLHHHEVENTLVRGNFRLYVEELEEPRVFHRLEHSALLNPDAFEDLTDRHPDLEEVLHGLKQETVNQYQSYALRDVETWNGVEQVQESTPAQATNALLSNLETIPETSTNVPNTGPWIGTVTGTQNVVGFDPADNDSHGMEHLYIVGGSGSGKTYLKRVILENVVSLQYNVLSISPDDGDTQTIGLNLPRPGNEDGRGIAADQYYPDHDDLPDVPDDLTELFTGVNALTLSGLPLDEKRDIVDRIFSELDELGKLSTPLFVFLEEAHEFGEGQALEAIEKISRKGRKFGINLVLVTQSPTDFAYDGAKVREQLSHVFLEGRYHAYADNYLSKGAKRVKALNRGEALFFDWNYEEAIVDVREPLTRVEIPDDNTHIDKVVHQSQKQRPSFSSASATTTEGSENGAASVSADSNGEVVDTTQLSQEQQHILDTVSEYIRESDAPPSYTKTIKNSEFGSGRVKRVLNELVELGAVKEAEGKVNGNPATVYRPVGNIDLPDENREDDKVEEEQEPESPENLGGSNTNEESEAAAKQTDLESEEQEILDWIGQYLAQHDEYDYVTASNTHRDGPASVATAKDRLEILVEKDVVEKAEIERSHNKTAGYRPK